MRLLLTYLTLSIAIITNLSSAIHTIDHIQEIEEEISSPDTLVLFNIAEVLLDTETSLGTQAWRKFIRSRVDTSTHDSLTWIVFKNAPPKAVESEIPTIIQQLQDRGQPTLAFTSRGRSEWYSSQVDGVDALTEKVLAQVGIDFSKTQLSSGLELLPCLFDNYFHRGIIYTGNTFDKGELLVRMLEQTRYKPSKIVFIDDKRDSLVSVEEAITSLGIPFEGYAYMRTAKDHTDYDPMVANIELNWLLTHGQILSDQEALAIKNSQLQGVDPEEYLQKIIDNREIK